MPYIGNIPAEKYASYDVQHITTSATSSYVLDKNVANENEIRVVLNNIIQQPGSSYAYTASGNTLTLSAATTSSDKLYVVFTGKAVQTVTPPPSSVGLAQFNATGSPGTNTFLRGDNSWATPSDTVSYLVKISADDTTPDFLNGKLVAGTGISLTEGSGGGDETLTVANTVTSRPNAMPLVINGDMAVSQRATSKTGVNGGGYFTIDRIETNNSGAFIGTWTQTKESLSSGDAFNNGFATSFKMDNTTANASPAANSQCRIDYNFEGQDLQLLKHGTANAEKTTVAFWIKATKTGTNIVKMYKTDADRSCSIAYTVSQSNTWEYKVLNFPADTSGAVIANDNTLGIKMSFAIAMGSNYTSGTLNSTWAASVSANGYVGQVNNGDSTSNNWEITGLQLEVGEHTASTIPPFQFESFGDNLSRCQRYYYNTNPLNLTSAAISMGAMYTTTTAYGVIPFPVSMRTAPTGDFTTGTGYFMFNRNGAGDSFNTLSASNLTPTICDVYASGSMSGTSGDGGRIRFDTTIAKIAFTAEL